jgi:hypothetical protein
LRIDVGHGESRHCRATLFESAGEAKRGRLLWRAKLVNEVAPSQAVIRDDGRIVVTLDEFRRGGAAHAVVIYDERGELLREYDLRELLHGDDWKHVSVKRRAIEWLNDATLAFVESPPQFAIKLAWGREIRIDLEQLAIVGQREAAATSRPHADEASDTIPPEILALFAAATSAPADAEAAMAETAVPTDEAMQRALLELYGMATAAGVEVEGLERAAALAAAAIPADDPGGVPPEPFEGEPGTAGNSATTAVPVPAPDPADPVDYVAWMQEQTLTDGPSAIPHYEAAMDAMVEWEGDSALFAAAMNGDPNALTSPEITAWLAANQEALEHFYAATDFEFRGIPMETTDDTVLGFLLPHLSKARWLSKAAVIEARQLEAAGDVDAAMGRYLDIMAAGAQAGQGPTLIENLVGIAMQALAANTALDSFARLADEDVDYVGLAEALAERYRPTRPIEETFQFERVMVLDVIQRAYEWNPETNSYRVSEEGVEQFTRSIEGVGGSSSEMMFGFVLGNVGFEKMTEEVNGYYDAMTDAARMPYQDGRAAFRDLEEATKDPELRIRNPLLATMMPSFGRVFKTESMSESNRRATMLVAQLKAYRQRHGTYPDSLDVFGDAEMTIDPFTDHSFAYRPEADDFVLYSLGVNGVDDGGVHDRRGETNDVLFWPRPPKD